MRVRLIASIFVLLLVSGCARWVATPVPMVVREDRGPCAVDTLLVLLPGAFDRPSDFIDEGFVDAVRRRGIAVDFALVDATVPYYRKRLIIDRLDADVIAPARARGIRHVWLAGVSIGGLGATIYPNERRGIVDGMILIAPYLGEPPVLAEIAASGGLRSWSPPGAIPPEDDDRRLWSWLKQVASRGDDAPDLYLGYGVDDRLAEGHRLLGAALAPDHVFTAPGIHDWPAWRAVWNAMLDAAPLPRSESCRMSSGTR